MPSTGKEEHVMADVHIEREETGSRGRYTARVAGREGEAELTYVLRAPSLISANHTGAPLSLRGSGAAQALVERLVADARAEGRKIIPLCSYIDAQFQRHPEWADLRAD
jgi:predicted GNAT family acetyltransferase